MRLQSSQEKSRGAVLLDGSSVFLQPLSALRGSADGADPGAGAAVDAGAGVDDVLAVPLRNGGNRAGVGASSAAYASVTDHIGHWFYTSMSLKTETIIPYLFQISMLNSVETGYIFEDEIKAPQGFSVARR